VAALSGGVVIEPPETQYAETPDGASIAYQVMGNGPLDLMLLPGSGQHVEMAWEIPAFARLFRRFASFSRLIRFDHRGTGLSDPPALGTVQPSLEERAKEMLVVFDAVGSERAAVVANGVWGTRAIFFAAAYPNRISSLVLDGCYARLARAPDYPFGVPSEVLDNAVAQVRNKQGLEVSLGITSPSAMRDPDFVAQYQRYARYIQGPKEQRASAEAVVFADVRAILPSIQAPTLVLYRQGDRWAGRPHAEYLASHIASATLVDLPGEDNLIFFGDIDAVIGEIEEFLTGDRHTPETDRVLATVLFTDIVDSTKRAAELGDRGWKDLLDSHDRTVRRQLDRFKGKEINTAGDGFFATFDGPGRAIQCACAIRDTVSALGIEVRVGLHTGEIELRGKDAAGMAVHIGARVAGMAEPGEVLVSGAIPPLVAGSGIEFEDRGEHELKGVPGTWRVFEVRG
jgi:class 3 adenylate cyclase/pimeloyl-ACP methyl ester carboxylesterase